MTTVTSLRPGTIENRVAAVTLSVVIPLKDEAASLPQLHAELTAALAELELPGGYELIFVDDGSRDGSMVTLQEFFQRDRCVQVIQFRRNFGKSAALSAGFAAATGEYVITLDADLQDVPAEMGKLLAPVMADEADLVSGWKTPRSDPITKTLPSAIFNRVVRAATGIKLHDFNCGFKAYRREVVEEVRLYGELHRYIPVLAHFRGFRVAETAVLHRPRAYGRSKFGLERYFRGFFDLLTVLFLNHYTRRPLHLFGWLGLLAFGTGFLIDAYLAVLKLGFGEPIGHRPLLTFGVLLMVIGALFVVFGLLGEMIAYQTRLILGDDGGRVDYSVRTVLRRDRAADG